MFWSCNLELFMTYYLDQRNFMSKLDLQYNLETCYIPDDVNLLFTNRKQRKMAKNIQQVIARGDKL